MDIYYENSQKEKIDLENWPIVIQDKESLYNNEWKYESRSISDSGGKITKFYKEIAERQVKLSIYADSNEEYVETMKRFMEITEYDIYNMEVGRLYIGEYYLPCYVIANGYSDYEELFDSVEKTITIVAENPQWIREKIYRFRKGINGESLLGANYPYNYPYNYTNSMNKGIISNENIANCNFEMVIYGKCSNPSILIGSHYYNVDCVVELGEYIVINSRTKKIIKYKTNGETESKFDFRNRKYNIFSEIKSGRQYVSWNGLFGFDIKLLEERSEPLWN